VIPQALWYFADETIATPKPGIAPAGFMRGVSAWDDIRQWASAHPLDAPLDPPPLIWIGSPETLTGAELAPDGETLAVDGRRWSFARVPKIPLNRSYYDSTSTAFLCTRRLSVRGRTRDGVFVARTLWPEDFRIDVTAPLRPLDATADSLRGLVRKEPQGGAQSPFSTVTLWERAPGAARAWEGAPVLALVLNGAQGDDDEAHAGHFALVTGRVGAGGAIGNWITNNFYTLDAESEKGILPAMLPLDDYLADLNSGQSWYRPSYVLVAVLRRDRVARRVQSALERVYNQFYRHQLVYRHTTMNCASISVDVLRILGFDIRARGATSWMAAALGFPYFVLHDRSVAKAAQAFDYLTEDRTRLLPAASFEEIGAAMLGLAGAKASHAPTPIEAAFADDVDALVFLSIPQLPSSRAWGDAPVASAWEYRQRYPRDPAKAKIIPVPPRPFPETLRDDDLLPPPRRRSDIAITIWAVVSVVGIPWLLWRWWRRMKTGDAGSGALALPVHEDRDAARGNAPTPQ
jgi:hypothetical protein